MTEVVYERSITIDAAPHVVWEVLFDVERWPQWTRSVERVSAPGQSPLQPGSVVRMKQPGMPPMSWKVSDVSAGRSFSWTNGRGLVRTLADHRVEAGSEGCRVTLTVRQSGPAAKLLRVLFGQRTNRYIRMEAEGLKQRAEQKAALRTGVEPDRRLFS